MLRNSFYKYCKIAKTFLSYFKQFFLEKSLLFINYNLNLKLISTYLKIISMYIDTKIFNIRQQ